MRRTLLLWVSLVLLYLSSSSFVSAYDNCVIVDPCIDYTLQWSHNATHIELSMRAKIAGWIGLGFSTDGSMASGGKGSDIIIGWANSSSSSGQAFDYWVTSMMKPVKDNQQDVTLIDATFDGQYTEVQVVRPLNTTDIHQDRVINTQDDLHLIYAANRNSIPVDAEGTIFGKHSDRGSIPINFSKSSKCNNADKVCSASLLFGASNEITVTDQNDGSVVYSLKWAVSMDNKYIDFTTSAKTTGWIALGLNSNSDDMIDADMLMGYVSDTDSTKVQVFDRYSTAFDVPMDDSVIGGKNDVTAVNAEQKNGQTTITFRRLLNTGDSKDITITNKEIFVLWAYGSSDDLKTKHINRGAFRVNLLNTTSSLPDANNSELNSNSMLIITHGIMMTIAWAICVPIGSYISRYTKKSIGPKWFKLHMGIQGLAVMIGLLALVLAIVQVGKFNKSHFSGLHPILGLILILVGFIGQPILGYISHRLFNPGRKEPPFLPDKLHWFVGYGLIIASAINIYLGVSLFSDLYSPVRPFVYVVLSIWAVLVLALGIFQHFNGGPQHETMATSGSSPAENDSTELVDESQQSSSSGARANEKGRYIGYLNNTRSLILLSIISLFLAILFFAFLAAPTSPLPRDNYSANINNASKTLSYHFGPFNIPNDATNYYCRGLILPNDTDYHIIKFTPLVDNNKFLHHMILYSLPGPVYSTDSFTECGDMAYGASFVWGWAVGGGAFSLPDNVGYRIGKNSDRQYYALQVHYDNPAMESGAVDNSGVMIEITTKFRQFDMGVLWSGTNSFAIPPGIAWPPGYAVTHKCESRFTNYFFPQPITVFGSFLHMHKMGRQIWVTQERNGTFLGEISRDDAYDFNDQKLLTLPQNIVINPGDEIFTTCVWDSSARNTTVRFGLSTSAEMCIAFLPYYPKLPTSDAEYACIIG